MEQLGKIKNSGFKERCQQICGDSGTLCFNSEQVTCIADMVINKAGNIKLIIEEARVEKQFDQIAEILCMASKNIDELINWIRYLQAGQTWR